MIDHVGVSLLLMLLVIDPVLLPSFVPQIFFQLGDVNRISYQSEEEEEANKEEERRRLRRKAANVEGSIVKVALPREEENIIFDALCLLLL